jgi:hypothetical protein
MKKISLLFTVLMLLVASANAQYVFKVLAAKGANKVFTAGSWTNIAAGTKVNKGDKLKLETGCYLGLIHPSTGKTIELKAAGTYVVAELETKIISGKADFGTKYANYVSDGMFAANQGASTSYDRTGTVSRAIQTPIFVYAPTHIKALKSEPVTLHWNSCGGKHKFTVTLSNYFGEVVYSATVDTNFVTIDYKNLKAGNDDITDEVSTSFLLKIVSATDPSYTTATGKNENSYTIDWIDDATQKAKFAELNKIKTSMDASSAMDYMVLAMAYEKEELTAYAVNSYAKAQQLAPDVDAFKTQYEEYIKTKMDSKSLNGSKGN